MYGATTGDKEAGGGIEIGELRWPVFIADRVQAPNDAQGITETYARQQLVHADVQSTSDLTFWGPEQTDGPVTHRIRLRWLDKIDMTMAVLRDTIRQDGTVRTEVFRIRRIKEVTGRKRFIELSVELEKTIG